MNISDLYQDLIIDHGIKPRNHYLLAEHTNHADGHNVLCGDKLTLYLEVKDDIICDVSFLGTGCAISMASASLLTELIQQQSTFTAKQLTATVIDMLTGVINDPPATVGKIKALQGVKQYPSRVKCATLAWHTLLAAIQGSKNSVSTE